MSGERVYPDDAAGPFPTPPRVITDRQRREIRIDMDARIEPLVDMYETFDPADRAQGLPPVRETAIREWLDEILEKGTNVVAWDEDTAVGHATLAPDGQGAFELAIFVRESHRRAGIGGALLRTTLGYGAATGVRRTWLTVERGNEPARKLYRSVGFEPTDAAGFELEMTLRLDPETSVATESAGDEVRGSDT